MDTSLIQTFFLVPAEFLLISMYDTTVKKDSNSTDFRLQTSLSVPTLQTTLDTTDRDHDHCRRAYATMTAVWPTERPSSRHDYVITLNTSRFYYAAVGKIN